MIRPERGKELIDILSDDLGIFKIVGLGRVELSKLYTIRPVQLLGFIAEAIIVRRCHDDKGINRKWISKARYDVEGLEIAKDFEAIATGSAKQSENILQ